MLDDVGHLPGRRRDKGHDPTPWVKENLRLRVGDVTDA